MTTQIFRGSIAIVLVIGFLVLVGWQFDIFLLKSGFEGAESTMKANTAICLILSGLSLLMLRAWVSAAKRAEWLRVSIMLLVLLVGSIGAITLAQYVLHWNAGIDELLFVDRSPSSQTPYPGRMGMNTATCFVLLSASVYGLLLETKQSIWVAQLLASSVGLIVLLSVSGYLFDVSYFYGSTAYTTAMAAHTAIALLLLCLGVCLTFPTQGWVKELTSPLVGGHMARQLLTWVVLYPLAFTWIVMQVGRGHLPNGSWSTLQLVSLMGSLGAVVWHNARSLNQAESNLRAVTASLEQRVIERTRDLVEMNEQLRTSHAETHALFSVMNDLVLIRDHQGYCLKVVTPHSSLLYQPVECLVGKTVYDTLPLAIAEAIQAAIQKALTTQTTASVEYSLPRSGQALWLDARVSPINATEVLIVVRDVTDRKQAEALLQQQTARIQQLNITLEGQVQERTSQLQTLLQYEATLKRITDRVRDSLDEAQILQTAVKELAIQLQVDCCNAGIFDLEQGSVSVLYEHCRSDQYPAQRGLQYPLSSLGDIGSALLEGQTVHCSTQLSHLQEPVTLLCCPLLDDQGVFGDLWLFRPNGASFNPLEIRLTKQVANQCAIAVRQSRLYQSAQAQVRELERLNHLKDDFLSAVSHELRTPMANIRMAIELLEITLDHQGALGTGATGQYFQILKEECHRETTLINDLLDLSRIEAEVEPLSLTTMEFSMWVMHLAEPFLYRCQQQQQVLECHLDEAIPPITTDFSYLKRVMTELLHNACKYTPMGERISIDAHPVVRGTPSIPYVRLQFTNTGVAIPPEECDRIFDKFYRIPNSDPWRHGGTGLGLALVNVSSG